MNTELEHFRMIFETDTDRCRDLFDTVARAGFPAFRDVGPGESAWYRWLEQANPLEVFELSQELKSDRIAGAIVPPALQDLNHPAQFDTLSPAEQAALLEWIRLAIQPARTVAASTSYGLKHQFERDGFYVVNGCFKGAMRILGYEPTLESAQEINWRYCIKPTCPRKVTRRAGPWNGWYGLWHLGARERDRFRRLVARARRGGAG